MNTVLALSLLSFTYSTIIVFLLYIVISKQEQKAKVLENEFAFIKESINRFTYKIEQLELIVRYLKTKND